MTMVGDDDDDGGGDGGDDDILLKSPLCIHTGMACVSRHRETAAD